MIAIRRVRPDPVTVEIDGRPYVIRTLRYPEAVRAMSLISSVLASDGGEALMRVWSLAGESAAGVGRVVGSLDLPVAEVAGFLARAGEPAAELIGYLLRRSLPDLPDPDDLTLDEAASLIREIWAANDVGGMLGRFFGTPPAGTSTTSGTSSCSSDASSE